MRGRKRTRGVDMRYKRCYMLLLASGHSKLKALQILLDAERGGEFALGWIRMLRRLRRAERSRGAEHKMESIP